MFENWFKNREKKRLNDDSYLHLFDEYEGDEVVVFDTETTGLNRKKDEILSVGAVIIKGDKILTSKSFEIYVKPSIDISDESIKIHRIRPCDIANGLKIEDAMREFLDFIQNRPIVGYYLEFDMAMVNRAIKPMIGIKLPNKQIEVSGIYFDYKNKLIPQGNIDLRFDKILDDLNIPQMGQHDALNDAIMTAMIYIKLRSKGK